jgi:hypothetical protein
MRLALVSVIGIVLGSVAPALAGTITITLSEPLKKNGCVGDTDGDCLNNYGEQELAYVLAPNYFWDGGENCDSGLHYSVKDFYQVRPRSTSGAQYVGNWIDGDGSSKWIKVSYYFLFPHDCNGQPWQGHLGDSENVEYWVYSYDLITWHVSSVRMHHHGAYHDYAGTLIGGFAEQLGTPYPNIAYDEDGHGSWPGVGPDSDDCAGSEDTWHYNCWVDDMRTSFNNGDWFVPLSLRNIGGPFPEYWKTNVVSVSGADVYSEFDVGHGTNREYWTDKPGFQKFCGWECSTARFSGGDCLYNEHGDDGCSSGLHTKVDFVTFDVGPPGTTCYGDGLSCGAQNTWCSCNYPACLSFGNNCCYDACFKCGGGCQGQ